MRALLIFSALVVALTTAGCESRGGSAAGGALGGAAVGVGAYEWNAHRQMEQLDQDYRAGRINRHDYEVRKQQIEKGSLFQK